MFGGGGGAHMCCHIMEKWLSALLSGMCGMDFEEIYCLELAGGPGSRHLSTFTHCHFKLHCTAGDVNSPIWCSPR